MKTLFSAILLLVSTFCYSQNGGGNYSLRQVCGSANPNNIEPYDLSNPNATLHYQWISYNNVAFPQSTLDPFTFQYYSNANQPLDLNPLSDGTGVLHINETNEFVSFSVYGSNLEYVNLPSLTSATAQPLQMNWSGLVVFKQKDLNNDRCNKRLWYPAQQGCLGRCTGSAPIGARCNFIGIDLHIARNSRVIVLSGYKAFNRLYFDNGGGITAEENVTFTSSCNMWGGIWVDNNTNCKLMGKDKEPITIENANMGIVIANDMCTYNMVGGYGGFLSSTSFPFGASLAAGGDDVDHSPAIVQLAYINFKNNYFHIYCLAETQSGQFNNLENYEDNSSFITHCTFDCKPLEMLPPYQPKVYGSGEMELTMTEACIVLYLCRGSIGAFIDLSNSTLNISNCSFNNAIYGIEMPNTMKLSFPNSYNRIATCAIRCFYPNPLTVPDNNFYEIENQTITLEKLPAVYKPLDKQLQTLDSYWNTINGFNQTFTIPCNIIGDGQNNISYFENNPNIARHGLSTGYPDNWMSLVNYDLNPMVGIYTPFDYNINRLSKMLNLKNSSIKSLSPQEGIGVISGKLYNATANTFENLRQAILIKENGGTTLDDGTPNNDFTTISQNKFDMCATGIQIKSAINYTLSSPEEFNYTMNCNVFNSTGNATGILFESGCATSNIGSAIYPMGNVFPVAAGTDRRTTPGNALPNDVWHAPTGWKSFSNYSTNRVKPYHFKNEFIRNSNDPSLPNIFLQNSNSKCYIIPNSGSQTVPDGYVSICDQSVAADAIYFPIIGRQAFDSEKKVGKELSINPNPASNHINISGLLDTEYEEAQIIDVTGKVVLKAAINSKVDISEIDLSSISTGVYNLILKSSSNSSTFKVIKL